MTEPAQEMTRRTKDRSSPPTVAETQQREQCECVGTQAKLKSDFDRHGSRPDRRRQEIVVRTLEVEDRARVKWGRQRNHFTVAKAAQCSLRRGDRSAQLRQQRSKSSSALRVPVADEQCHARPLDDRARAGSRMVRERSQFAVRPPRQRSGYAGQTRTTVDGRPTSIAEPIA